MSDLIQCDRFDYGGLGRLPFFCSLCYTGLLLLLMVLELLLTTLVVIKATTLFLCFSIGAHQFETLDVAVVVVATGNSLRFSLTVNTNNKNKKKRLLYANLKTILGDYLFTSFSNPAV